MWPFRDLYRDTSPCLLFVTIPALILLMFESDRCVLLYIAGLSVHEIPLLQNYDTYCIPHVIFS
jgi:hypothetical protein